MIPVILVIASVILSSNARHIESGTPGNHLQNVKNAYVGDVEISGTIDKDSISDSTGEILVDVYPFQVGLVRDKDKELNALVILSKSFTLGGQSMYINLNTQAGKKNIQTALKYLLPGLTGHPLISLQGSYDVQDNSFKDGQASVMIGDRSDKFQLSASAAVNDSKTELSASIVLGPVSVTLKKDKDDKFDQSVRVNSPILKVGNHPLLVVAGAHQNTESKRDFYVSADSDVLNGQIDLDSQLNIDVTGGVTLYDATHNGIKLSIKHYHDNQNEYHVEFQLGPLLGNAVIDDSGKRIAALTLHWNIVKLNVKLDQDSKVEYVVNVVKSPVQLALKGNQNGLVEIAGHLGENKYSISVSSNLDSKYSVDLVLHGRAFSFEV